MDLESLLNMAQDLKEVEIFLSEHGGRLQQASDQAGLCWLELHPSSEPSEAYFVRLLWTAYPHQPPSVKFANSIGGDISDPRAWPVIEGYRASSFDICKPFTAEAFALHAEWKVGPLAWDARGNPFLFVVQTLQNDLNLKYRGRVR
jgi:hypothetical protein